MATATEADVREFWNEHPCGAEVTPLAFRSDPEAFFRDYDGYGYRAEPNILDCFDGIDWHGK